LKTKFQFKPHEIEIVVKDMELDRDESASSIGTKRQLNRPNANLMDDNYITEHCLSSIVSNVIIHEDS